MASVTSPDTSALQKKNSYKIWQVTYQINQHDKRSINMQINIQILHYRNEFSKFYLVYGSCLKLLISNFFTNFAEKITKKYWISRLILLHTDSQTSRQYQQEKNYLYLYSFTVKKLIQNGSDQMCTIQTATSKCPEGHKGGRSLLLWLSPAYCFFFACMTFKAIQQPSKFKLAIPSIQSCHPGSLE